MHGHMPAIDGQQRPAPGGQAVPQEPGPAQPGRRRAPAASAVAFAGTQLRHGYTLDSLTRLAHHAARRKLYDYGTDPATQFEVAFAAIAEHLYSAGQPPAPPDLVHAALTALSHHHGSRRQFLGLAPDGGTWRGFERYWQGVCAPADSPEDKIVDRIALAQIWPRLTPASRDAFTALAAHGDYQRAAQALGISYKTFKDRISEGRRQFLALWHDGEKPSRPWVRDRRAGPGTDQHTITYFLRSRRLRAAAAQATKTKVGAAGGG
jgi:DNA-directed RNA polymerase specialized sigma24 family protein